MSNNKNNFIKNSDSSSSTIISFNNVNYAIYKIGNWKNSYEINLIGNSNEIPATEITKKHVLSNMDEIRASTFEMREKKVNGIVGLSIQLNLKLQGMDLDEIIAEEEKEYKNILDEINELKFEDPNGSIELENDKFLIYKLEKEYNVTVAKPANVKTMKHHMGEIQRLKESNK